MRLQAKFILLIVAVALGLGLSSSFLVSQMMKKAMDRQLRDQAMLAAQTLAEHITHSVIDGEVISAREAMIEIVNRMETIKYVYIIGFDNKVFAHTFEGGFPKALVARRERRVPVYMQEPQVAEYATDTGRILDIVAPLIEGMAAHVHIGMDEEPVQEQIASIRNRIIGLSMVLALVGIAVGAIVSRRLTTPLAQMADSMREFGEGGKEEEIDFAGRGKEIADLTSAFNRMITERKRNEEDRERDRKFMQTVIDGLPEPMMVVNRDYTIAMTNRATREITKGKDPVAAGLKCYQIFHKLDTPCGCDKHPCPMQEVIKTKTSVTFEHIHYDAHGQEIIVELAASPIFDENGEVVQIIEASRDITERRQAEKSLQESEARYRELFDNMSSGVAVYEAVENGRDFVFKDINRTGERINKTKKEDVAGKKVTDAFPGVEEFGLLDVFRRVYKTGKPEHHPVSLYKDNKCSAWFENYIYKLPYGEIVSVHDDVTERKQAEEERESLFTTIEAQNQQLMANEQQLRASNQQLSASEQQLKASNQQLSASEQQLKASNQQLSANEQQLRASNQHTSALNQQLQANQQQLRLKNEELQSIVYVSSHDLKTPLVNINGFSELLMEHCGEMKELLKKCDIDADMKKEIMSLLSKDIPTDLEYISTSAQRMKRLIAGLLQVSRIGTIEFKTQKIDMNDVLTEIINTVKYKTEDLNAKITLGDLPDCTGDKHQITQVFTNLIDNALKYLSPDRKGNITITGKTQNDESIYCIEDNGIGIKQAYFDKVFEIYHRLDPKISSEGDGLGLTIVRRILDRHKGGIWLESEVEKGSKFFVSIPTT